MSDNAEQTPGPAASTPATAYFSNFSPRTDIPRFFGDVFDRLELRTTRSGLGAVMVLALCLCAWIQIRLGRLESSMSEMRPEIMLGRETTTDISTPGTPHCAAGYPSTVDKPDFALHTSGGRIIPGLTSPSHFFTVNDFSPPQNLFWALRFTREEAPWPAGPAMAIHHGTWPGYCWAFSGSKGHLGVYLARRIFIQSVAIEHLSASLAWDRSDAPRRMELWGLLEISNTMAPVKFSDALTVQNRRTPTGDDFFLVRLAQFEYELNDSASVQTFPVDAAVQSLPVLFRTVILEIEDNWGHTEYTCVYRVRVHGSLEPNSSEGNA